MGGPSPGYVGRVRHPLRSTVRYREGQPSGNPDYPYSEGMHAMLSVSMVLGLIIGGLLLYLGKRGNIMWLRWWSGGLISASIVYLAADFAGFF